MRELQDGLRRATESTARLLRRRPLSTDQAAELDLELEEEVRREAAQRSTFPEQLDR